MNSTPAVFNVAAFGGRIEWKNRLDYGADTAAAAKADTTLRLGLLCSDSRLQYSSLAHC
jgi:hypothetical protein